MLRELQYWHRRHEKLREGGEDGSWGAAPEPAADQAAAGPAASWGQAMPMPSHLALQHGLYGAGAADGVDLTAWPSGASWQLGGEVVGGWEECVHDGSTTFRPTERDIGFELHLVAQGQTHGVVTRPVLPLPPPPPAARPMLAVPSRDRPREDDSDHELRVMSWNVLAELYAGNHVYPYCHEAYLSWHFRKRRLLRAILRERPHIVCLQEVQVRYLRP